MRISTLIAALCLLACGSSETPEPAPAAEPAPAVEPAEPEVPAWKILAPSPRELEAEVEAAGIAKPMADLVPTTVPEAVYGDYKDKVAMHTGVVFAYTLLGGKTSEKGVFLTQVRALRKGLGTIGAGKGLLKTLDRAIEQIQNDAAARDDFLAELDAQVQSSVPEEGWGPNDTTGPLLQAGAWLGGIHIVAQAVVRNGDDAVADKLLKRPEVAKFFLQYVQSDEGESKCGPVCEAVAEALTTLKNVSERDAIGVEGAKEIVTATDKLLKLL